MSGPGSLSELHLDQVDLWELIQTDIEAGKGHVQIINGHNKKKSLPVSNIKASLSNATKPVLNPIDAFSAAANITATSEGMGRFSMQIPAVAGLKDYVSCGSYGEVSTHGISLRSYVTPTGWFASPKYDYEGAISAIAHLGGSLLCISFPRSIHNQQLMEPTIKHALGIDEVDFLQVFDQLEQVSCHVLTEQAAFLLSPFEYYGFLCLESSIHIGGPAWRRLDLKENCQVINQFLDDWSEDMKGKKGLSGHVRHKFAATMAGMTAAAVRGAKRSKHEETVNKLADRLNTL